MTQKSHDSLIPHLHFFLNYSGDVDGGGHYRAVSPDASCPEVGGPGSSGWCSSFIGFVLGLEE